MTSLPRSQWVSVKTTLPARPLPANAIRPTVTTDRLVIRALVPEDLQGLHAMRAEPEVMATNPQGRPDRDIHETKPKLDPYLPPNDQTNFNFAICLKATGEMIGMGGCHKLDSIYGWPAISYMFRKDFWGQGLATEFLHAWLDIWGGLPRAEAEVFVDPRTLTTRGGAEREQITAFTTGDNVGSQRVLEKCGFENFLAHEEPDLRNPAVKVVLLGFRLLQTS
ncbi:acyl-CoA N-acyltransferase [Thozetella sp. PMI_491]|nr:acyl-CoA N-acyltransferase [Thozetella sp. PMI_491]